MSARTIRLALRSRPRFILAILLAFAVEMLPPSAGLVTHRHAGGGIGHTHVGPIQGADGGGMARSATDGLTRAPASDWHQHFVSPVVAAPVPEIAVIAPALLATRFVLPAAPRAWAVAWGRNQARAPPLAA